jgi:hypothetical protein
MNAAFDDSASTLSSILFLEVPEKGFVIGEMRSVTGFAEPLAQALLASQVGSGRS